MAEWKKEIGRLARDFYITREEVIEVFRLVERTHGQKAIPEYYKGSRNEFLYDKAQKEIMSRIYA